MDLVRLFNSADDLRHYAAGDVIFRQGEPGDLMYVIIDGEIDVLVGERVVEHMSSGDILGEMALIETRQRSATAVASSDCRLALVDEKRFLFLVEQAPAFALHVMRALAERLRKTNASLS